MIFSDYRQPYNFLAHEEPAPDPLDSSTPLPTSSKADSYPGRHKKRISYQESFPGQLGFNLRKHNSESNFPMQALQRTWFDSQRGSFQGQGSIREDPLEEQRVSEDTAGAGTSRGTTPLPDVASVASGKSKRFWRRKSEENLTLDPVQEGQAVTLEEESPEKKKKLSGRKGRNGSHPSLSASREGLDGFGSSNQQTQQQPEKLTSKPPLSPTKNKFWQKRKSGSQVPMVGTASRKSVEAGGIFVEDLSAGDGFEQKPTKRGSLLRRFSKGGSRTSLSKSDSRFSLSKSEGSLPGEQDLSERSPKKRRSSILGKFSRFGSKLSLNKSQSSLEELDSVDESTRKSLKKQSSLLGRISKSRSSLSKSEDSLEADPNVDKDVSKAAQGASKDGAKTSRSSSVLRKLSKNSKTSSRRSSKAQNIPSALGTFEDNTQHEVHPMGAEHRLSQSGSTLSLSKGVEQQERSTFQKKKGIFGKKKSSSRISLNKSETGDQ